MPGVRRSLRSEDGLAASTRGVLVLLCALLLLPSPATERLTLAAVLLALLLVGVAATTVRGRSLTAGLVTLVEAALWATGVILASPHAQPLLPYLIAPALVGGLTRGLEGLALPVGVASVAVLAGAPGLDRADLGVVAADTGEWVGIALVVGLLAAWVHRLSASPDPGYAEAYQLLGQLRTLTRALPVGLDAAGIAEDLLRQVQAGLPHLHAGAVYSRSPGNLPSLRATTRHDRMSWRVDLSEDSVFTEAWSAQVPCTGTTADDAGVSRTLVALPLVVANRTVGLVALTLGTERPAASELDSLQPELDRAALRLETAMLFDELREMATVEERRRLAREIHDGVAQDLAAFGYELDALARDARLGTAGEALGQAVLEVRSGLGRLVTELRNSIFELRTEVDQHGGLGAALTEYVRGVGAASDLTVHLSLDERPDRLPSFVEAELLRIAQEAVTNARKHAQAENLWVTCQVNPPHAFLRVEDDGTGPGEQRDGSFGLEIMRERAARLRAELDIDTREPQGTVVTCRLGPPR